MTDESREANHDDYNLLGISSQWVESLTEHAKNIAYVRLSYALSTRDELEVPRGNDDWQVRLTSVLDDTQTRELHVFEVGGIDTFTGPHKLAEWFWEEATDHWRGVRLVAESAGEVPPKRMRCMMTLLDPKHGIIDEIGVYIGARSHSRAERRARASGVNFAETTDAETGEPSIPPSASRINRELERGYIAQLRLQNDTSKAYAKSVTDFADKMMTVSDRYREASLDDAGEDDAVALAFLELGKDFLGHARERKGVRDDISSKAPKDGGGGGPACAFAREALKHFDEGAITRCRELLGGGFNEALACLRYATEANVDEKRFLKRFRQSAEWFIAIAQSDPSKLRAVPVPARDPLQACASLALAG